MRFVPVKTAEHQSVMVLHRSRLLLMRQRTRLANAIRGHNGGVRHRGADRPCGTPEIDRDDWRRERRARAAFGPCLSAVARAISETESIRDSQREVVVI